MRAALAFPFGALLVLAVVACGSGDDSTPAAKPKHAGSGGDGGSGGLWTSAGSPSHGDDVSTPGCDHDGCTAGTALDPECDPCAQAVCSKHPECCQDGWDPGCVQFALTARGCDCGTLPGGEGGAPSDGGSGGTAGGGTAAGGPAVLCDHDACTVGEPLGATCDACTASVCNEIPECCDEAWGVDCIADATTFDACPVCSSCDHSVCEVGLPLKKTCGDPCIQKVCDKIETCCTVAWDGYCVGLAEDCAACGSGGTGGSGSGQGGSSTAGGAPGAGGAGGTHLQGGAGDAGGTTGDGGTTGAGGATGDGGSGGGVGEGGQAGAGGSGPCGVVVINEVCPGNVSATDEFVDLYNDGECDVSVFGFELRVISAKGSALPTNPIWTGPVGAVVERQGRLRISTAATDGLHMKQSLAASSSLALFASSTAASPLDAVAWGTIPAASLAAVYVEGTPASNGKPLENGSSVLRVPDGFDTNDNSLDLLPGPATPAP